MFGPLKPIPKEEYMKIYQSTGIDIDGRREMIKHMIPCIEKAIKRFICFAKSLPGFKDLPINDQISLIKGRMILLHTRNALVVLLWQKIEFNICKNFSYMYIGCETTSCLIYFLTVPM